MKKRKTERKKNIPFIIKMLLLIALVSAAFVIVANIVITEKTKDKIVSVDELKKDEYDCILVLGAGLKSDGTPSDMLEDRLLCGIDAYESGASSVLLMSGDHGRNDYDEVNAMLNYAVQSGIDEDFIFLDHAGFSTYESLYRARDIFGVKKAVIISQKYHLYRALFIADSLGIDAVGISADIRTYRGQAVREFREVLARTKDLFSCIFKPMPKYLGDPIDLGGSALQTRG